MGKNKMVSINPSTEEILGEVDFSTKEEITTKVKLAQQAKRQWKNIGTRGRAPYLKAVIDLILKNKQEIAELQSKEMGMPIAEALIDVKDAVRYSQWYLDHVNECLSPQTTFEDSKSYHCVVHDPYGVAAVITPWNFPISNFVWGVMQNLTAGNVVVFKHSEECPLFGKKIESVVQQASFPDGVFSEIYGDGTVGNYLVHQNIDLIWFTGSTKVGKLLYKLAADKFIKAIFELGGSSPGIVFADADIDRVIDSIFFGRFFNCGQVCDGLKRLIVHESRYEEIVQKLNHKINKINLGDAMDSSVDIGPLVAKRQLETLELQVQDAVERGAKIICGGKRLKNKKGYFYELTLLTNISRNMKVWAEEVFGPVLPIVSFKTEQEAIKLANDTPFGLGSYIFTEDKELAKRVAQEIETGMIGINNAYYGHPATPFGGQKLSGLGRDHGVFGFRDLTQPKVIAFEK